MPRKLRQTNQKARGRQQIATDGLHNNAKNSLHGPKVTEAVPSPAGPVKIFDPTQPLQPTGNTENAPLPTAAAPQLAQPYPAAAVHGYSDGCGENEQRAPAVDGSQYYAQYGHPTGDVGEQYSQQGAPVVQYDQYQWSQQCGYANPAQGYAGEQTHPAAYPLADPQQQKGDISQQSWPNTHEGVDGLAGAQQHSWHAYQYGDWHGQEIRAAAGANFQQPAQGPTSGDPSSDQYAPQDTRHGQEPLPTAGEYASGYVEGVSAADACPREWGQGYEQRTYPEPVPQHTEDTVGASTHNDAGTGVQAEARSFDAASVDYWGNIGSGCEPAAVVETPAVEEPAELHQLPVITQADAQINTASTFFGRSSSESEFEFISKENEDGGGAGEAAAVAPLGYTPSCHSSISNSSLQTINLSRRESCEQVAADARLDPAAGHDGNHLSLPDGQNGQRHHRSNSEPFDHEEAAAREEGGRDLPLAPHPPPVDFFLPSLGGTPTAESHESAPAQFAGEDSSVLVGSSATAGVAIEAATAFTGEAASPSPIPDHNIESTADAMQETKPSIAMLSQSSESQQSEGSAASHVSATCHPGEAIQGEPSAINGIAEQTGARLDVAAEEEKQEEGEEEEGVPAYHAHPSYTQEKIRSAFPEAMQPTSLLPAADVCAATPIIFSPPQLGNILTYQTPSPVASVSPARDSSAQYDCDVMQPPHLATPAGTVPFGIPSESVDNRQDAVDSRRVPAPGGDGGMPYAVPSVPQPAALPQVEQSGFPPQPILQPMQSAVFVPEPAGASMDVIVSSSHDASLDGVTPMPAFAPQPPEPAVTIRHVPGNGIGHAFAPYERPPDLVAPAKHEADDRRQAGANGEIEKPRSERPEEDGRRADGRYRDERRSDRDGDRSEREYKRRDDDRRYDRDGKRDHRDDRRQDRDYRRRDGDDAERRDSRYDRDGERGDRSGRRDDHGNRRGHRDDERGERRGDRDDRRAGRDDERSHRDGRRGDRDDGRDRRSDRPRDYDEKDSRRRDYDERGSGSSRRDRDEREHGRRREHRSDYDDERRRDASYHSRPSSRASNYERDYERRPAADASLQDDPAKERSRSRADYDYYGKSRSRDMDRERYENSKYYEDWYKQQEAYYQNYPYADPRAYYDYYRQYGHSRQDSGYLAEMAYYDSNKSASYIDPNMSSADYYQQYDDFDRRSQHSSYVDDRDRSRSGSRLGYEESDGYSERSDDAVARQRLTPHKFRMPHTLATLTPSGALLKVLPNSPEDGQPARVELHDVQGFLGSSAEMEEMRAFPGPLVKSETHKKDVIIFCQNKIKECKADYELVDKSSAVLLWELNVLLIRQNGTVVGTDIADLLLADYQREHDEEPVEHSDDVAPVSPSGKEEDEESKAAETTEVVTENRTVINRKTLLSEEQVTKKFRDLLLYGHKKDALDWSMKHHSWGHALFLASKMDARTYANVMTRFANSLALNDPLQTLYQLMSGRQPGSVTSVADHNWGDWRPHLAMILSNGSGRSDLDQRSITSLADTLAASGCLHAAHFCYLMADVGFGTYKKKMSKLVLIGSNHRLPLQQFATNEAVHCTEVYEYAMSLSNPQFVLPGLQAYKFMYACRLAEFGFLQEALHYCEVLTRAFQPAPALYSENLVAQVYELGSRLKYHDPHYTHGEGEITYMADPDWLTNLSSIYTAFKTGALPPLSPVSTAYAHLSLVPVRLPWEETSDGASPPAAYGRGALWPSLYGSPSSHCSDDSERSSSYAELAAIHAARRHLWRPLPYTWTPTGSPTAPRTPPCSPAVLRTPMSSPSSPKKGMGSPGSPKKGTGSPGSPKKGTGSPGSPKKGTGSPSSPKKVTFADETPGTPLATSDSDDSFTRSPPRGATVAAAMDRATVTRKDQLIQSALTQTHDFSGRLEHQIRLMKKAKMGRGRGRRGAAGIDAALLKMRRSPSTFVISVDSKSLSAAPDPPQVAAAVQRCGGGGVAPDSPVASLAAETSAAIPRLLTAPSSQTAPPSVPPASPENIGTIHHIEETEANAPWTGEAVSQPTSESVSTSTSVQDDMNMMTSEHYAQEQVHQYQSHSRHTSGQQQVYEQAGAPGPTDGAGYDYSQYNQYYQQQQQGQYFTPPGNYGEGYAGSSAEQQVAAASEHSASAPSSPRTPVADTTGGAGFDYYGMATQQSLGEHQNENLTSEYQDDLVSGFQTPPDSPGSAKYRYRESPRDEGGHSAYAGIYYTPPESPRSTTTLTASSPEPGKKVESPTEHKKKEHKKHDKRGWFGGIFNFGGFKGKNEMKLPEDKNPSIVWDATKNRWVNQDGDDEEEKPFAPPPKDSDMMSGSMGPYDPLPAVPVPAAYDPVLTPAVPAASYTQQQGLDANQQAPQPTPAPPAGGVNRFKMRGGKGPRSKYVDVLNPTGAPSSGQQSIAPPNLFPTNTSSPMNFFVPTPVSAESTGDSGAVDYVGLAQASTTDAASHPHADSQPQVPNPAQDGNVQSYYQDGHAQGTNAYAPQGVAGYAPSPATDVPPSPGATPQQHNHEVAPPGGQNYAPAHDVYAQPALQQPPAIGNPGSRPGSSTGPDSPLVHQWYTQRTRTSSISMPDEEPGERDDAELSRASSQSSLSSEVQRYMVPDKKSEPAAPPGPTLFDPAQFTAPITNYAQQPTGRMKYGQRRAYPR